MVKILVCLYNYDWFVVDIGLLSGWESYNFREFNNFQYDKLDNNSLFNKIMA